ncbi:MAG: hypothetical protein JWM35_726 [Verrucomicrobia bacterium]|nr:hypothetical protein [Verrucomicrobiota bacterium]
MYEHHKAPLVPREIYLQRVCFHFAIGFVILAFCVGIGMAGYHWLENLGWVDAFVNASMILSGMGPLDPIRTTAGKIFAGFYSLFSGIAFLTTVGFFLMPTIHRFLHMFHHAPPARESDSK